MARRRGDPHDDPPPRGRRYDPPGPVPTLGSLLRQNDWVWVNCARTGCWHREAFELAPLVERWGADASSDVLRRRARCSKCGHLGATLMAPSCDALGNRAPFPGRAQSPSSRPSSGKRLPG